MNVLAARKPRVIRQVHIHAGEIVAVCQSIHDLPAPSEIVLGAILSWCQTERRVTRFWVLFRENLPRLLPNWTEGFANQPERV